MTDTQRKVDAYRESNLEAARIVAVDPVKYAGLMQEWALLVPSRAVLARGQQKPNVAVPCEAVREPGAS